LVSRKAIFEMEARSQVGFGTGRVTIDYFDLVFIFSSLASTELIMRLGFSELFGSMQHLSRAGRSCFLTRKGSDHWKELAARIVAIRCAILSTRLVLMLALVTLPFGIVFAVGLFAKLPIKERFFSEEMQLIALLSSGLFLVVRRKIVRARL
jgi:hypothetical protein